MSKRYSDPIWTPKAIELLGRLIDALQEMAESMLIRAERSVFRFQFNNEIEPVRRLPRTNTRAIHAALDITIKAKPEIARQVITAQKTKKREEDLFIKRKTNQKQQNHQHSHNQNSGRSFRHR